MKVQDLFEASKSDKLFTKMLARFDELYSMKHDDVAALLGRKKRKGHLAREVACQEVLAKEFGSKAFARFIKQLPMDGGGDI